MKNKTTLLNNKAILYSIGITRANYFFAQNRYGKQIIKNNCNSNEDINEYIWSIINKAKTTRRSIQVVEYFLDALGLDLSMYSDASLSLCVDDISTCIYKLLIVKKDLVLSK